MIAEIQARVAADFNRPRSVMQSPSRYREDTRPRQVAMYLARGLTGRSWERLGRSFKRDHTTVIHGVRAVEERLRCDDELRLRVHWLRLELEARA